MLLFNALYYLLFMAIPVWLYYRRRPECLPALRLNPLSFRATVVLVLTAFAGVMVVTVLSYFWTLLLEWLGCDTSYAQMTIPTSTRGLTLYVFSSCVLPGICEDSFRVGTQGRQKGDAVFGGAVYAAAWIRAGNSFAIAAGNGHCLSGNGL